MVGVGGALGFDGEVGLDAGGGGLAVGAEGADEALRIAWGADGGAEFHEGLVEVAGAFGGDEGFGAGPEFFLRGGEGDVFGDGKEAGEDAHDVAIKDRGGLIEGDRGNGAGGVATDAGERGEGVSGSRENAGVEGDDLFGGGVKMFSPTVVAEAGPEGEDILKIGGGELGNGGEAFEEAVIVGNHRGDLGLLEHGFGEPDGVGIGGFPPGHWAFVAVEPFKERRGEVFWARRGEGHGNIVGQKESGLQR